MEQNNQPLFVIDDDPIVEWPVTVRLPIAGGQFADHRFNVSMRVLTPAEYEELFKSKSGTELAEASAPEMSEVLKSNVPVFQRVITGWDESVKDRAGDPVPFTLQKLAEQVTGPRGPALSVGLWRAINEVRFGMRVDGVIQPGVAEGN